MRKLCFVLFLVPALSVGCSSEKSRDVVPKSQGPGDPALEAPASNSKLSDGGKAPRPGAPKQAPATPTEKSSVGN